MFLKKIWNKIINNQKNQELRFFKEREKNLSLFKDKHEDQINLIKKNIKNKNKLNFI